MQVSIILQENNLRFIFSAIRDAQPLGTRKIALLSPYVNIITLLTDAQPEQTFAHAFPDRLKQPQLRPAQDPTWDQKKTLQEKKK